MDMYEVWVSCGPTCHTYQPPRERLRTSDPAEAIKYSQIYRDADHDTEIRTITL